MWGRKKILRRLCPIMKPVFGLWEKILTGRGSYLVARKANLVSEGEEN
jgi:hypothetical protein